MPRPRGYQLSDETKKRIGEANSRALKGKKQSEHIGFETALFDITSGFRIYETNEIKNKTPKDAAFVSKKSFETNPALEIPIKSSKEYLRIELLKNSLPSFSSSVSSIQTP